MQIRVSTGNCRIAVAAAIVALTAKVTEDRTRLWDTAYERLTEGAVYNGLTLDENRKKEMREMIDRDLEHAMEQHPGKQTLDVLNNFTDMLAYHHGDTIVIDDQDFNLLKEHLAPVPANPEKIGPRGFELA